MRIEFSPTALRSIQSLPEKIAMACVELIYGPLAENPRRVGKPLRGELTGQFSARRGTYRIVYEISDDVTDEPDATSALGADARDDYTGVLRITRIDHRADVYRKQGQRWIIEIPTTSRRSPATNVMRRSGSEVRSGVDIQRRRHTDHDRPGFRYRHPNRSRVDVCPPHSAEEDRCPDRRK